MSHVILEKFREEPIFLCSSFQQETSRNIISKKGVPNNLLIPTAPIDIKTLNSFISLSSLAKFLSYFSQSIHGFWRVFDRTCLVVLEYLLSCFWLYLLGFV